MYQILGSGIYVTHKCGFPHFWRRTCVEIFFAQSIIIRSLDDWAIISISELDKFFYSLFKPTLSIHPLLILCTFQHKCGMVSHISFFQGRFCIWIELGKTYTILALDWWVWEMLKFLYIQPLIYTCWHY